MRRTSGRSALRPITSPSASASPSTARTCGIAATPPAARPIFTRRTPSPATSSRPTASPAAFIDLDDGLAYDFQTDSLLISPDTSTTIYQYSTGGSALGSFPWTGSGCYNSGLALGGQLLYQGSDGCNHVWVIDKTTHAPAFDFATGADGVRDEDLECDSVTFSPKTVMWSMEAYSPRRAIAFEIPAGSCDTGGGVDSDGDGLLDSWETNGVYIQPNGGGPAQFIDLPAMGADPNKPDIFLQIDWMQDATHNQALSKAAIQTVANSFANSPYSSPTGSVGINFHVDEGANSVNFPVAQSKAQSIPWQQNLGTFSGGNYDWTAFQTIKDANFTPTGRTPIFHYVIAANNYGGSTSSGISRGIGASDLIVSLGSFSGGTGTQNDQTGTLMHELGHNLGLRHGGGDDTNYKPNYLSIMSYAFQLQGVIKNGAAGDFDYSRSALPTLNEGNLNEPTGLGAGAAGFGTRHYCGGNFVPVANANGPIDWNCNGVATDVGVSADINGNGSSADTLTSFNDWANLKLKGGAIGLAGATPSLPTQTADDPMTPQVAQQIVPLVTDTTPPSCALTGVIAGPPKQIQITVQDTGSGLAAPPNGVIVTSVANATVAIPSYAAGSTSPVVVTATKIDQTQGASVTLQVTDVAGNVATCDPVATDPVRANGKPVSQTVTGVQKSDTKARVWNDGSTVDNVTVTVNGKDFKVTGLQANQQASVDISSALTSGANSVVVTVSGKPGSTAMVLFGNI